MHRMRDWLSGAIGMVFAVSSAAAAPITMELAKGVGGPVAKPGAALKNAGPGNEQPSVVSLLKNGKRYLVTIFMSSDVPREDRPWQCKCSSVELTPTGPVKVADQVQLTKLNGNRPCNHPAAATDGDKVVWLFGSNDAGLLGGINLNDLAGGIIGNLGGGGAATVQTYATAVDEMCKTVAAPIRVSNNANNNEGAPDLTYNGNGVFTGGYLSTNGDNDISYAIGLKIAPDGKLQQTFRKGIVAPANIGRPTIVPMSETRSLFCAAAGNNRPPEIGVECNLLDTANGNKIWGRENALIAASKGRNRNGQAAEYMNQPALAKLDDKNVVLQVIGSNGAGRNKNDKKGLSTHHLHVLAPTDAGPNKVTETTGMSLYQTHTTVCGGKYGVDATPAVAVFEAPITGGAPPAITTTKLDGTKLAMLDQRAAGAERADSGYLANLYGQNPNTQGRDFLRCIGDVPNPGYGVQGGMLPQAKTLFVAPYTGKKLDQPKNALFMSLIPAAVDAPQPPDPPAVAPGGGGNPGALIPGVDNPGSGTGPVASDPGETGMMGGQAGMAGCAVGTGVVETTGFGFLLLMSLLLLPRGAQRRRR